MSTEESEAQKKLENLARRLSAGQAKQYPVSEGHLSKIREVVADQWKTEQERKRRSAQKPRRPTEEERQRKKQTQSEQSEEREQQEQRRRHQHGH